MKSITMLESLGRTMARIGLAGGLLASATLIAAAQQPDIDVASMNGGERYHAGEFAEVTWNAADLAGNVTVSLWDATRCSWIMVASTVPAAAGHFSWRIPRDLAGDRFRVKIQSIQRPELYGMGGGFFAIEAVAGAAGVESSTEAAADLVIRPNPASSGIELTSGRLAGSTVRLRNLQGEVVRELGRSDSDLLSTSVDGLPNGIYLLESRFGDGSVAVTKLVVRR